VVQAAHLCGAAWGAALTLLLDLRWRRRQRPD
jgi:hypothetical protein